MPGTIFSKGTWHLFRLFRHGDKLEFGKVKDQQILEKIPWQAPPKDSLTLKHLERPASSPLLASTKLYIGAPAWNHKEWVGKIYPDKTKPTDYLKHYAGYFNTIELNTTHYRIPSKDQAQKWRELVEQSASPSSSNSFSATQFLFCPKVFKGISHERSGLTDKELLKGWFQGLEGFRPNLGPCFLQLPPTFDYSAKTLLFKLLQQWPKEYRLTLELRHPSWFQEGAVLPALSEYLHSRGIGLVILDVAGRRDLYHGSLSAGFAMIRFIGNSLHPSDYKRAQIWNEQLLHWEEQGLKEVFFFVHEPEDILIPEMTEHLKTLAYFKKNYELLIPRSIISASQGPQNLNLF